MVPDAATVIVIMAAVAVAVVMPVVAARVMKAVIVARPALIQATTLLLSRYGAALSGLLDRLRK